MKNPQALKFQAFQNRPELQGITITTLFPYSFQLVICGLSMRSGLVAMVMLHFAAADFVFALVRRLLFAVHWFVHHFGTDNRNCSKELETAKND